MSKRFYDFLLMEAAAWAAMVSNPELYSGEKRSHFERRNVKVKRTPEPTMREFSIHGEKITARDRKTAIKIYELKHKKV